MSHSIYGVQGIKEWTDTRHFLCVTDWSAPGGRFNLLPEKHRPKVQVLGLQRRKTSALCEEPPVMLESSNYPNVTRKPDFFFSSQVIPNALPQTTALRFICSLESELNLPLFMVYLGSASDHFRTFVFGYAIRQCCWLHTLNVLSIGASTGIFTWPPTEFASFTIMVLPEMLELSQWSK